MFLKGAADPATFVNWPSCKEYDLVDAWEEEDQPLLGQAQYRMPVPWPEAARFVVALPDEVAQRLPDARFDYVYLDDRRDYCRTAEEIAQWWPELRPGGDPGGEQLRRRRVREPEAQAGGGLGRERRRERPPGGRKGRGGRLSSRVGRPGSVQHARVFAVVVHSKTILRRRCTIMKDAVA